ncbi:MAG: NAD(P)-binding domain-containing protein [Pirellulales bacterium]
MGQLSSAGRWCVIGAGPSGLSVARQLSAAGVDLECLDAQDQVGGNWYLRGPRSSVCHSTHLISSKRMTEFPDFPMPADYPAYPRQDQVWHYLNSYADHFQLRPLIRHGVLVERVVHERGEWAVTVAGESSPRLYDGLVVANGHHWDPIRPSWAGDFAGELLTARDYKWPDQLRGRRVLVVGAGNSGCDLAVEAATHAATSTLSMRRGYYFFPKFLCGLPADVTTKWLDGFRVPLALRRLAGRIMLRVSVGPLERYGLPRPDHRLFETHPIVNSQLLYAVGHGRVKIRPDVHRVDGRLVEFVDGTREEFDTIVLATGYRLTIPFLDSSYLNTHDGLPSLYLHAFHPDRDDLMVAGMIQPNGGQWPLTDAQARILVGYLSAREAGLPVANEFRKARSTVSSVPNGGIRFDRSSRHRIEVDYFDYLRACRNWERRFARSLQRSPR